jgi:hypothetical protein
VTVALAERHQLLEVFGSLKPRVSISMKKSSPGLAWLWPFEAGVMAGHDHAHDRAARHNQKQVFWAMLLTGGCMVAAVVGGVIAGAWR